MAKNKWRKISASIITLREGSREVSHLYYRVPYYFPIIEYQYEYQGNKYKSISSKKEGRKYEMPEINQWGDKLSDTDYFWRSLKPGDEIPVLVNLRNLKISQLDFEPTKTYKSEKKAVLLGSTLVLAAVLGILWLMYAE